MTSRRRRATVIAITAGVLVVAGVVTGVFVLGGAGESVQKKSAAPATAVITRMDLATSVTLQGSVGYADEEPVALAAGRITWLPAAGATVAQGQPLLRVDDRPVSVFYGDTPLFRSLDTVGLAGRDVKVVADNLAALGYPVGAQPKAGTVVRIPAGSSTAPQGADAAATPPAAAAPAGSTSYRLGATDAVLTPGLMAAVRRWQAAVGLPQTGVLGPDDLVVRSGETKVVAVAGRIGGDASTPILTVASTARVVTVTLKAGDTDTVHVGDKATLGLPDGTSSGSTVASIDTTSAASGGDQGSGAQPALTATLIPDKPDAVAAFDGASVQAAFTGEIRKSVLTVPVGALLALSGGGYGVERVDGAVLPVHTGLFASSRVEISGDGVLAGIRVVTTS